MTLQITDGTLTVNLLNGSGLYLKVNGWRPAVASEDENGDYQDMIEVITLTWNESTDDSRATTLKNIKKLDRKARRYWRERRLDGMVWLAASTHSETDTRYGIIKSIEVPDGLSERHWGADGPSELTLVITHQVWWGVEPSVMLNGGGVQVVTSETIYNKQDADGDNFITIDSADIDGDATALTIIKCTYLDSAINMQIIAALTGDSSDLDDQLVWFIPDDLTAGTSYTTADTAAPGDVRIERTIASGSTIDTAVRWEIPAADVDKYNGDYLVYCVCGADLEESIKAIFSHGFNVTNVYSSNGEGGVYIPEIAHGSNLQLAYLGQVSIPSRKIVPGGSVTGDYILEVEFDKVTTTGSDVTFYSHGIFLIPIHQNQIFQSENAVIQTTTSFMINGVIQEIYNLDFTNHQYHRSKGQYIELTPGEDNRLYFYWQRNTNLVRGNDRVTVDAWAIPRYTSLRGND